MQDKITKAKDLLPKVKISRDIKLKIATVCSDLNIDGLRGDLVLNRASQALVAFEGRTEVRPGVSYDAHNMIRCQHHLRRLASSIATALSHWLLCGTPSTQSVARHGPSPGRALSPLAASHCTGHVAVATRSTVLRGRVMPGSSTRPITPDPATRGPGSCAACLMLHAVTGQRM